MKLRISVSIEPGDPPKRDEHMNGNLHLLQSFEVGALDLLDMYDERLVALGEPKELVYSVIHVTGKAEARRVLARGEGDRK